MKSSALTAGALVFLSRGTALATGDEASGGSWTRTEIKYCFKVVATPHVTNPEQVDAGWKNKKIEAEGDQGANTIKRGPWDSGWAEFYGLYNFSSFGPQAGDHPAVTFGGWAKGRLYEDDWFFDDLEAVAEVSIGPRTWSIDADTGVITPPIEVLSIEDPASPGDGYAKLEVKFGEVIGRVQFDYNFVQGFTGSAGANATGGSGGGGITYSQATTKETVFGFVWRIKVKRTTRVFNAAGALLHDTVDELDPQL